MIDAEGAKRFADEWVAAWNARDLERVLAHWADDCVFTSPLAARLVGHATVRGKDALRAYWKRGLEANADLHFEMHTVFVGADSVVLGYTNHRGERCAEMIEIDARGLAVRGVAHYAG